MIKVWSVAAVWLEARKLACRKVDANGQYFEAFKTMNTLPISRANAEERVDATIERDRCCKTPGGEAFLIALEVATELRTKLSLSDWKVEGGGQEV